MKRSRSRQRERLRAVLICLAAVLIVAAGLFLLRRWELADDAAHRIEDDFSDGVLRVRYQGKWYRQNSDIESLLLIGVDRFEDPDNLSQQADFLMLLLLDKTDNSYTALHINRDTMAEVPMLDAFGSEYGSEVQQLALSHAYGTGREDSCRNTVKAVSNFLFGVKIDHYIATTMDAVPVLNDLVGGVTVHVEDDFSGVDASIVKGENITLMGEQALHFVRARGGMEEPTNTARMERQRTYLDGLRQKLTQCLGTDDSFAMDALMEVSPYMVSDCTLNELSRLFDTYGGGTIPEILTIAGDSVKGERYMEFHADEAALEKQVIDLYFVPEE